MIISLLSSSYNFFGSRFMTSCNESMNFLEATFPARRCSGILCVCPGKEVMGGGYFFFRALTSEAVVRVVKHDLKDLRNTIDRKRIPESTSVPP